MFIKAQTSPLNIRNYCNSFRTLSCIWENLHSLFIYFWD